jgi:phosphoglycolate phosphatase
VTAPRALIFDWDNTLVDTWPTIEAALNATLVQFGQPAWSADDVRARVRASLRDSFPKLFGDRWTAAQDYFYQAFARVHLEQLAPLPGAADLLRALAAERVPVVVVSNKNGHYLRTEVAALGWEAWFRRLVGAGDAAADKPSRLAVELALAPTGIAPAPDVWFIGDTGIDIACARAAGCTAVLIGDHATEDERQRQPPDHHVPDLAALHRLLATTVLAFAR